MKALRWTIFTAAALTISTGLCAAQPRHDSPSSPAPVPDQNAAPSASSHGTTGTGDGSPNAGSPRIIDPNTKPNGTKTQTNTKTQPSNTGGVDD